MKSLILLENIIQNSILEQIRQANFFFVMVDEVTSNNTEVMPLCIRFIDSDKCIREEFIVFHSHWSYRRSDSNTDMW